jgi:hypothetical protein
LVYHRGRMRLMLLGAAVALLVPLAGCPGDLENPERFMMATPPDCDAPTEVFAMRCAIAGCHGTGAPIYQIDAPDFPASYIDVPTTGCSEYKYIDSASPEDSFIFRKVSMDDPGCATSRMPADGTAPLSDEEIECVRGWLYHVQSAGPSDGGAGDVDGGGSADGGA